MNYNLIHNSKSFNKIKKGQSSLKIRENMAMKKLDLSHLRSCEWGIKFP